MRLRITRWFALPVLLTVTVGLIWLAASGLDSSGLLCLLPALLLAAALLARRYPGERLLLRLGRARKPRRRRPVPGHGAPHARELHIPRGGLLLGFALAVRPPPGALAAS